MILYYDYKYFLEVIFLKFYICDHCGNIIAYAENKGVPVICCGEIMRELKPNTTDAATEKHVPVISVDGKIVTVTVGSVAHPMTEEHHISWIALETKEGNQRKELPVNGPSSAKFALSENDELLFAYAYCNLHGLWKASK